MTTILRLDPPIPLYVPSRDDFMEAWFMIDRGLERYTYFSGPLDSTGEIWEFDNTEVRACTNHTIGRHAKNIPLENKC